MITDIYDYLVFHENPYVEPLFFSVTVFEHRDLRGN